MVIEIHKQNLSTPLFVVSAQRKQKETTQQYNPRFSALWGVQTQASPTTRLLERQVLQQLGLNRAQLVEGLSSLRLEKATVDGRSREKSKAGQGERALELRRIGGSYIGGRPYIYICVHECMYIHIYIYISIYLYI